MAVAPSSTRSTGRRTARIFSSCGRCGIRSTRRTASHLLERFLIDALKAGDRAAEGHRVVARYEMEHRLQLVRCPVLLVDAVDDPHASPFVERLRAELPTSSVTRIGGGMVPLPDQLPDEFARAVVDFLGDV